MKTSEALQGAHDKLIRDGWIQNDVGPSYGPNCLMGALNHTAQSHLRLKEARAYLFKVLPVKEFISRWNDAEERTLTDVLDALQHAIKLATEDEERRREGREYVCIPD